MSKLETNTIDTLSGTTNLTIGSTNSSTVTFEDGSCTGHMYPAFMASLSANQSISDNTETKIQFNSESLDTGGYYDNSTNYRFTPLVAGKYFVFARARFQTSSDTTLEQAQIAIKKNGTTVIETRNIQRGSKTRADSPIAYTVIDLNGSTDYIEAYGLMDSSAGITGVIGNSSKELSSWGAYRIGS